MDENTDTAEFKQSANSVVEDISEWKLQTLLSLQSSGTAEKCSGVMYEITGHDPTNPIHNSSIRTNTNSTSMPSPSLTPSILGTMVLQGWRQMTETCNTVSFWVDFL